MINCSSKGLSRQKHCRPWAKQARCLFPPYPIGKTIKKSIGVEEGQEKSNHRNRDAILTMPFYSQSKTYLSTLDVYFFCSRSVVQFPCLVWSISPNPQQPVPFPLSSPLPSLSLNLDVSSSKKLSWFFKTRLIFPLSAIKALIPSFDCLPGVSLRTETWADVGSGEQRKSVWYLVTEWINHRFTSPFSTPLSSSTPCLS